MSLGWRPGGTRSLLKSVARWTGGSALIIVGLALSLPGVPGPGILIALLGLFVLLPESSWLQRKYSRLKRRWPRVVQPVEWRRRRGRIARRRRDRRDDERSRDSA
jgi:hypothetical protein